MMDNPDDTIQPTPAAEQPEGNGAATPQVPMPAAAGHSTPLYMVPEPIFMLVLKVLSTMPYEVVGQVIPALQASQKVSV